MMTVLPTLTATSNSSSSSRVTNTVQAQGAATANASVVDFELPTLPEEIQESTEQTAGADERSDDDNNLPASMLDSLFSLLVEPADNTAAAMVDATVDEAQLSNSVVNSSFSQPLLSDGYLQSIVTDGDGQMPLSELNSGGDGRVLMQPNMALVANITADNVTAEERFPLFDGNGGDTSRGVGKIDNASSYMRSLAMLTSPMSSAVASENNGSAASLDLIDTLPPVTNAQPVTNAVVSTTANVTPNVVIGAPDVLFQPLSGLLTTAQNSTSLNESTLNNSVELAAMPLLNTAKSAATALLSTNVGNDIAAASMLSGTTNTAAISLVSANASQNTAAVSTMTVALNSGNEVALGQQLLGVLRDKVQLQLDGKNHNAQIRLDPPRLGAIDIRISVEGDRTVVHLSASQAVVREAMVQTIDQLKLSLAGKLGGEVTVSTDSGDSAAGQQQRGSVWGDDAISTNLHGATVDGETTANVAASGLINRLV